MLLLDTSAKAFNAGINLLPYQNWRPAIDTLVGRLFKLPSALPEVENTPMAFGLTATAEAIGTDTNARTNIDAHLKDYGKVSVGWASVTAEAIAQGGPAVAIAEVDATVTGADFVFVGTKETVGRNYETDTLKLLSIDFDAINWSKPKEFRVDGFSETSIAKVLPSGNFADATFNAIVEAAATLSVVDVNVTTVADAYAGSSVDMTLGFG